MNRMNDCTSKAEKPETNSYFRPLAVVNPNVDTYGHPEEMTHVEYILVPRELAQKAIALLLNHNKPLEDSFKTRDLSDIPLGNMIGTKRVAGETMAKEDHRRKLVAIFIADVVGYARLMNEDEIGTVRTLTLYKQKMKGLIERCRGRVVDSPGDNLMAEFPSVMNAVQCAVTIQKKFEALNRDLPEKRQMAFRIGINLGDVIGQGNRIYGDRVNIAARLEALADPGGICISRTVYDQIEDKLPLTYEYLGEKKVKNIPKPVRAYRIIVEREATHSKRLERKPLDSAEKKKEIHVSPRRRLMENIANFFIGFFVATRLYARKRS